MLQINGILTKECTIEQSYMKTSSWPLSYSSSSSSLSCFSSLSLLSSIFSSKSRSSSSSIPKFSINRSSETSSGFASLIQIGNSSASHLNPVKFGNNNQAVGVDLHILATKIALLSCNWKTDWRRGRREMLGARLFYGYPLLEHFVPYQVDVSTFVTIQVA